LRFDPDTRSATALRRADPHWASRYTGKGPRVELRDQITHHVIQDDPA